MSTPAVVPLTDPVPLVGADTLQYLGLDPKRVETRALVLLANRYRLDPLVGEIALISTRAGAKVYISRDGMIQIAHRSGQLDGIVVDEERRSSQNDGWTAYVSVWRKDCAHPFRYGAQCKDSEPQAKAGNGPEMALARAERRALRRAFAIPTDESFDPDDPADEISVTGGWDTDGGEPLEVSGPPRTPPGQAPVPRLEGYPLVGGLIGDRDWWTERARQAGIPAARILTRARELAGELKLDLPRSVEDLTENPALTDAVLAWLDDVSQEPF